MARKTIGGGQLIAHQKRLHRCRSSIELLSIHYREESGTNCTLTGTKIARLCIQGPSRPNASILFQLRAALGLYYRYAFVGFNQIDSAVQKHPMRSEERR